MIDVENYRRSRPSIFDLFMERFFNWLERLFPRWGERQKNRTCPDVIIRKYVRDLGIIHVQFRKIGYRIKLYFAAGRNGGPS